MAQGQVLEGELAVAAEEEGEKPKQVEQESDHRAEIVSGPGPPDQPLGRRMRFWRWTGRGVKPVLGAMVDADPVAHWRQGRPSRRRAAPDIISPELTSPTRWLDFRGALHQLADSLLWGFE